MHPHPALLLSQRPDGRHVARRFLLARPRQLRWGARTVTGQTGGAAVFGLRNGNTTTPLLTKLVQITDGTSNTLMMSEIIVGKNDADFVTHGDIFNDDAKSAG